MTQRTTPTRLAATALALTVALGTAGACTSGTGSDPSAGSATASAQAEPTIGMHYDQIGAEHPDFPPQSEGRRDGDTTVFRWRDRDWVFDDAGVLVKIGDGSAAAAAPPAADEPAPDAGGADEQQAEEPRASGPLPDAPQGGGPECSTVHARQDVPHPAHGTVRVFLATEGGQGPSGCIIASAPGGETIYTATIGIYGPDQLAFGAPVTDPVTGNSFVTYNPGRYDGVFVLIPSGDGFVAPDVDSGGYQTDGRILYYSAKLVGTDTGEPTAILETRNDCEPTCAEGTQTSHLLTWDGYAYTE